MSLLTKLKDAVTGPTPEEVREKYEPAGECPNCKSAEDYWKAPGRFSGTMYRCLNCGSEGMGP